VLGYITIFIAIGVVTTMIPAGIFVVERNLKQEMGAGAYSDLVGVVTSGIMFLAFVIAGVVMRWRSDYHKRFMLLATIIVLWPAWFRFRHYFPSIPHPEVWFALVLADGWIVMAWVWEKLKFKKVHPITLYGGALIILEQTFEMLVYDSASWQAFAKWLYESLT
jgi:hypothetical protein